jgi:hypothetical protein
MSGGRTEFPVQLMPSSHTAGGGVPELEMVKLKGPKSHRRCPVFIHLVDADDL